MECSDLNVELHNIKALVSSWKHDGSKWKLTFSMTRRSFSTSFSSSASLRTGISAIPVCSSHCVTICLATSAAHVTGISRSSQNIRAKASGVISLSAVEHQGQYLISLILGYPEIIPLTFQTNESRILKVSTSISICMGTRIAASRACSSSWSSELQCGKPVSSEMSTKPYNGLTKLRVS